MIVGYYSEARLATCVILTWLAWGSSHYASAQPTEFTYQGQLKDGGASAGGDYDMTFRLFNADNGGAQIGADIVVPGMGVTGGLFSTELDFGVNAYTDNQPRWLEITVNAETLLPRQPLTPAPFSINTRGINVGSTGNVGIGTAAPAQKLSVAGTIESTTAGFKFPDGTQQVTASTTGPGFWSASGNNIFKNNSGNVGIGLTSPGARLHCFGTAGTDTAWFQSDRGGNMSHVHYGTTGDWYVRSASSSGKVVLQDTGGNVGIGTLSPGARLHVAGGMKIDAANTLEFGAGIPKESSAGKIGYQTYGSFDSLDIVGAGTLGSNRKINFWNEGGATFKGNVGIGTLAPASKLDITAIGAGAELLRFTTERPWIFRQIYSGPSTGLQLYSTSGLKNFEITCSSGPNVATFVTEDANPRVGIATTTPGATLDVNGTTRTKVLQITGADVAEKFPTNGEKADPGTVMEIDPQTPGQLRMARGEYNQRVAGVVSGANDFPAGAILGHMPGLEDAPAIALSGRVWVKCDASAAAIELGNLLTTSDTPGHAMAASDRQRSHGAVLGKAMSSLKLGERGLVLVLVNLQ